ncbi:MAG: thermonuclease family protein [Thermoplasmata archaeon]
MLLILAPTTAAAEWQIDGTAVVTRVLDGDTFDADPAGRVRLADVDTPEVGEPGAAEATAQLSSLVYHRRVYLDVDDLHGRDMYGRLVAVVFVRHNMTHLLNVNQALLEAGVAEVRDFPNSFDPEAWTPYVFHPVEPRRTDEVPLASWLLGVGFIALEVYFLATLLRAWRGDRRSRGASREAGAVDGRGGATAFRR